MKSEGKNNFGSYIRRKRENKKISLRKFAFLVGISPEYLSKIENSVRPAPKVNIVEIIAQKLDLNQEEVEMLYDMAAESKESVSLASDLITYINENETIHKILRIGKRCNIDSDDWEKILECISEKYL